VDDRVFPARPFLAASVAVFREGRVLIARRARAPLSGLYSLPGGGVELGETLREAALRELAEEAGIGAEIIAFLDHVEPIAYEGARVRTHFVIASFVARWREGEARTSAEIDDFAWIPPERIGDYATTPDLPRLIAAATRIERSLP
jgi:8-oxo-dGTP diphosphatase